MTKKILITGGLGYIGSHTLIELHQAGYESIVIDNLSNSQEDILEKVGQICQKRPTFYRVDCCNKEDVMKVFQQHPDIIGVIHFAASKAVGESVENPLLYYRNNIDSLLTVLETMKMFATKAIVFSSSCTVYGQPSQLPVDESSPILPALSPYGNTKQINEEIIHDTIHSGVSFKAILLRYFNPIGAHPSALIGELPKGTPQNLVPFLTQTAAGIREELSVFGNDYNTPDGSCIRDYIHVTDLAKAHVAALNRMLNEEISSDPIEIFNVGTGKGVSVLELIHTFESVTGVKVPHRITARRAGDIEQVWANTDKANKVLGWKAKESLESALKSAWDWQKNLASDYNISFK